MQVSIIMPVYNAERYVVEAIESILAQSRQDFELIIIDDGSKDKTLKLVKDFASRDSRIKVAVQARNGGIAHALNRGIDMAAHEWLVRMDADDVMLPDRLEKQVAYVQTHPDVAVVSGFVYHIDHNGRVIGQGTSQLTNTQALREIYESNELIGFHHPAVIMKKSVVQEAGGYRPETVPAEDVDLWNRIIEHGHKLVVQPDYVLKYRIYGESTTERRAWESRLKILWVRECMIARRHGQPEPSWEAFMRKRNNTSLLRRLNQNRKDLAKVFYKSAVVHYANRNHVPFLRYLLGATALQPGYVFRQVRAKYLPPERGE